MFLTVRLHVVWCRYEGYFKVGQRYFLKYNKIIKKEKKKGRNVLLHPVMDPEYKILLKKFFRGGGGERGGGYIYCKS